VEAHSRTYMVLELKEGGYSTLRPFTVYALDTKSGVLGGYYTSISLNVR